MFACRLSFKLESLWKKMFLRCEQNTNSQNQKLPLCAQPVFLQIHFTLASIIWSFLHEFILFPAHKSPSFGARSIRHRWGNTTLNIKITSERWHPPHNLSFSQKKFHDEAKTYHPLKMCVSNLALSNIIGKKMTTHLDPTSFYYKLWNFGKLLTKSKM